MAAELDPAPEMNLRSALRRLRAGDAVLAGKRADQPLILFRHGRFHMLSLGYLADAGHRTRRGVSNVHFMSLSRARRTVAEWLPYSRIISSDQVCPHFAEELACKVLAHAADYGPLVRAGLVTAAGGATTDTLAAPDAARAGEEGVVACIAAMMAAGGMGPFLHFERTWQVLRAKTPA